MQRYLDTMEVLVDFANPTPADSGEKKSRDYYARARNVAKQHLETIVPEMQFTNEWWEWQLLEQTKVRSRDYYKLTEIDDKILEKLSWFQTASDIRLWQEKATTLDTVMKELDFVEFARVNGDEYTLWDETYVTYLGMLRRLNMVMKHLHRDLERYHSDLYELGKWTLKSATKNPEEVVTAQEQEIARSIYVQLQWLTEWYADRIEADGTTTDPLLYYTDEHKAMLLYVWKMQRDYECTLGVRWVCEQWKRTAESSRQMVKDRWQNDGKRAGDTFNTAWKRLKGTLRAADSKSEDAAQERQEQLVSQYRWNDLPEKRKRREVVRVQWEEDAVEYSPMSVTNLMRALFESKKERTDRIERDGWRYVLGTRVSNPSPDQPDENTKHNTRDMDSDEEKEAFIDAISEWYLDEEQEKVWGTRVTDMRSYFVAWDIQREKVAIQNAIVWVLRLQDGLQTNALVTDITQVTKQFPLLSYALTANSDLWWDKHDEKWWEGSIYLYAQTMCKQQCSENITDKSCGAIWE